MEFPSLLFVMEKSKVLQLIEALCLELKRRFRLGERCCLQYALRAVHLKDDGLSVSKANTHTQMSFVYVDVWG